MFGYVVPYKPELKVRDLARYNAYYCGLCNSIQSEFGLFSRLLLNYDCTFAALFIDGIQGAGITEMHKCPLKPLSKKQPFAMPSEGLRFSAALCVLLAWYKFIDDWNDEQRALGLAGKLVFKAAAKKARSSYPELNATVAQGLSSLAILERDKCENIDKAANAFANLLAGAVTLAPFKNAKEVDIAYVLVYNIGRWIYLIDAWHDRERDKRTKSYNVFNINNTDVERAHMLLEIALNEALRAYDLLDIKSNKAVLDNIIYMGCFEKTNSLLFGKATLQNAENITDEQEQNE